MSDCPAPETMAQLADGRLSGPDEESVLGHVADCDLCRRHLSLLRLPELSEVEIRKPSRVFEVIWAAAAAVLVGIALWIATRGDEEKLPEPEIVKEAPKPEPEPEPEPEPIPKPQEPERPKPEKPKPKPEPEIVKETPKPEPKPDPEKPKPEIVKETPKPRTEPIPEPKKEPKKPDTVVKAPEKIEPGRLLRASIRNLFGTLSKKTSCVLALDDTVVATSANAGFELQDGIRMRLLQKTSVRLFQSETHGVSGVELVNGIFLLDFPEAIRSVFLKQNGNSVLVEKGKGSLLVHVDRKSDTLYVSSLYSAVSCRTEGEEGVELKKGHTFKMVKGRAETPTATTSRMRQAGSLFQSWPNESPTLIYYTFEPEMKGERRAESSDFANYVHAPKEGIRYISSIRKDDLRILSLKLPEDFETETTAQLQLRLRIRTNLHRVWFTNVESSKVKGPSGTPIYIPARQRSETKWARIALNLQGSTVTGSFGTGDTERFLTFTVEIPRRMAPDRVVLDIDEIEIINRYPKKK